MAATACATSDDVVSMLDVLQEDAVLEDEANAVLGASDDKQCTYNEVATLILIEICMPCLCNSFVCVFVKTLRVCLFCDASVNNFY